MTTKNHQMQAISYVRYSSKIQMEGDSDRRQNERVSKWLSDHAGFNLVEEYSDEGLSAFSGAHLEKGSDLSRMLTDCKRGIYQPNAVILIEAFDRLSRGGIDATQQLVREILLSGMRLVILQDNPDKFYDRSDLNDAFAVITIAIKAQAAYEESEKKQKRGLINWSQKRLLASQGKIMTRACPAWLKVDEEGKRFEPVEPHLSTVRRIFRQRLAGDSMSKIAKSLNEDLTPNFKGGVQKWNQTTVQQLLKNPAVYGCKVISTQATDDVKASAEPIENYYVWTDSQTGKSQVAISLNDFQQVNQIVTEWAKGRASGSRDDARLINVFKSVLVCSHCGASIIQSSIKPVNPKLYTYGYYSCSQKRLGRCPESKAIRRDHVEASIIQGLLYNTKRLLSGTKASENELVQMQAEELLIQDKQRKLVDLLLDDRIDKDTYNTRYDALTANLDQLQKQINQHRQVISCDFPSEYVRNIDLNDKAQRFELQQLVKSYVTSIRLDGNTKSADIEMTSGYVLNHYPLERLLDGDNWIEYLHVMGLKEYTFTGAEKGIPIYIQMKNAPEWVQEAIEEESQTTSVRTS